MTTMVDIDRSAASATTGDSIVIRPATAGDAAHVHALITENLVTGHLLARPLREVELHMPRFLVAGDPDEVIGCGELARLSATSPRSGRLSSGARDAGPASAGVFSRRWLRRPGHKAFRSFALYASSPNVRPGRVLDRAAPVVPDKIATDCQTCELFRRCHQYAVVLDLGRWAAR